MIEIEPKVPSLIKGGLAFDDRGCLSFVNDFDFLTFGIRRFYQVRNHEKGFIRAWHGHKHESKFAYVVHGVVLIQTINIIEANDWVEQFTTPACCTGFYNNMKRFVLSDASPAILFIPSGYYNGFKTLTDGAIIQFFSTSTLGESKDDDIRINWDIFGRGVWEENYR